MKQLVTDAELEEARLKIAASLESKIDPEEQRLLDRVAEALRELRPRASVCPHHDRGKGVVSVWPHSLLFGPLTIILQVGREHLMEVYSYRTQAEEAVALLDTLTKRGFTLSTRVVTALDKWAPGRTLASKRFDDMTGGV